MEMKLIGIDEIVISMIAFQNVFQFSLFVNMSSFLAASAVIHLIYNVMTYTIIIYQVMLSDRSFILSLVELHQISPQLTRSWSILVEETLKINGNNDNIRNNAVNNKINIETNSNEAKNKLNSKINNTINNNVYNTINTEINNGMNDEINNRISNILNKQIKQNEVENKLNNQIYIKINDIFTNKINIRENNEMDDNIRNNMKYIFIALDWIRVTNLLCIALDTKINQYQIWTKIYLIYIHIALHSMIYIVMMITVKLYAFCVSNIYDNDNNYKYSPVDPIASINLNINEIKYDKNYFDVHLFIHYLLRAYDYGHSISCIKSTQTHQEAAGSLQIVQDTFDKHGNIQELNQVKQINGKPKTSYWNFCVSMYLLCI